jgi:hypothetical protein
MMQRNIHSLVLTLSAYWLIFVTGCFSSDAGKPPATENSTADPSSTITKPLDSEPLDSEPLTKEPAAYVPPSDVDYVGSESCTQCHAEVAQRYATHPMSESAYGIDVAKVRSRLPLNTAGDHEASIPGKERVYTIDIETSDKGNEEVRHHEKVFDADGELIYDDSIPVQYVVGSDGGAIAYLCSRDNLLFMSPLNWYGQEEVWDFAPEHSAEDSRRFSRRVNDECLSCHVGRIAALGRNENRFQSPPFHQTAIGCENCHGPGAQHIAFHETGLASDVDPMIDIASLDHQRREAICYQCHLHAPVRLLRPGRSHFDFRPGQLLDSVWSVMVDAPVDNDPVNSKALSQVQQMHASVCYKSSYGQLGCISCHDPHGLPAPEERLSFYKSACLQCHTEESCIAPQPDRLAQNDACTECHMPVRQSTNVAHVSLTDHRIVRRDTSLESSTDGLANLSPIESSFDASAPIDLEFLWDSEQRLPAWERDRTLGIGLWLRGSSGGRRPPTKIADLLRPIAEKHPDDGAVQTVLGAFYSEYNIPARAKFHYEAALANPETKETALANLLTIYYLAGDWQKTLATSDQLLGIDPQNARAFAVRADALAQLKQFDTAVESAESGLRYNPSLQPLRDWLIRIYEVGGFEEKAAVHRKIYDRLKTAKPK